MPYEQNKTKQKTTTEEKKPTRVEYKNEKKKGIRHRQGYKKI